MKIYAYNENMLSTAQKLIGGMLDFAVNGIGESLKHTYSSFIASPYSVKVENGDSGTIMGMSGAEIAYDILGISRLPKERMDEYSRQAALSRSPEYWSGWALAHYQWETSLSFDEINNIRDIESIILMYKKYHEIDLSHFSETMNRLYLDKNSDTKLKKRRNEAGLSQKDLAERTGIPLKTIQQYEQRQKNINHARVDYLVSMSKALSCDVELLIEKIQID